MSYSLVYFGGGGGEEKVFCLIQTSSPTVHVYMSLCSCGEKSGESLP